MKVVDLHPEELLDKEARGELTELERERLEAHLERCATCRFERDVRADFADELADDGAFSSQRVVALLESSLPSVAPTAGPESPASPPGPPPATEPLPELETAPPRTTRQRRHTRVLLLAAAALFVGGVATAGIGARVWDHLAGARAPSSEELTVTPPEPPSTALATRTAPAASSDLVVREPEADAAATDEAPTLAPTATGTPAETAASLFESASEARRRGDYSQALALHRRLQAQYPASRESHASAATVGRLLLDRGDPAGALASFDAYQRRGTGAFDEPVLVGRATALERLGRTAEARAAWQALVTSFPDTPWRSHAEARLSSAP